MGSGEAPLSQRGRVWSCRRVGGRRDLRTPQPSPQAPRARTHARTPSRSMGAPGRPSGPRARPGACWSGIGGVRGAGRRQQPESGRGSCALKYSTPRDERCGPLARPAGQSEREAKPKALRAPRANPSGSGPISLKAPDLDLGWETTWESRVLEAFCLPEETHPTTAARRLHLGLLWLASGNPGACTDSSQSPSPRPTPASQAIAHAHVRTHAQIDVPKRGIYLFLREPPYSFPYRLYPCPFLLTVEESSLCSTSSPALVIDRHRSEAQSDSCEVASLVVPSGGVWLLQKCEDLPSSSDFGVICNHPESFQV
ncbi:unnamed protein product [Ceratitis capitata]|uniref:(Mediterranean fruit fly) hypothetical protein n=1 Tax=Ceratitis capitata TaxID=7213 RepID=A0A811VGR4_CERCA|nr:unnamed protein product [Ceratitis capitata]